MPGRRTSPYILLVTVICGQIIGMSLCAAVFILGFMGMRWWDLSTTVYDYIPPEDSCEEWACLERSQNIEDRRNIIIVPKGEKLK